MTSGGYTHAFAALLTLGCGGASTSFDSAVQGTADARPIDATAIAADATTAADASSASSECDYDAPLSDHFDPYCVYLLGTLTPGYGGRDVVLLPRKPDHALAGFAGPQSPTIDENGTLIRIEWPSSSIPIEDEVAMAFAAEAWQLGDPYPETPLANDSEVATLGCNDRGLRKLYHAPDGAFYFSCYYGPSDVYAAGESSPWLTLENESVVAVGPSRVGLVHSYDYPYEPSLFANGQRIPLPGLGSVYAARWHAGAFLAAVAKQPSGISLYRIPPDGEAEFLGDYNLGDTAEGFFHQRCALEATGRLWCTTTPYNSFTDMIHSFTIDGEAILEYNENEHPVKMHGSGLFTGNG